MHCTHGFASHSGPGWHWRWSAGVLTLGVAARQQLRQLTAWLQCESVARALQCVAWRQGVRSEQIREEGVTPAPAMSHHTSCAWATKWEWETQASRIWSLVSRRLITDCYRDIVHNEAPQRVIDRKLLRKIKLTQEVTSSWTEKGSKDHPPPVPHVTCLVCLCIMWSLLWC